MKKYLSGFVPVNFKKSGFILLTIGLTGITLKVVSFVSSWFYVPNNIFYFCICLVLLSFYLIKIVAKNNP